jgi:hypothetical protein
MKTFLRKVSLSFLAMLCGWIACNIELWILAGYYELFTTEKSQVPLADMTLVIGVASGIVILAVWLVIILPTDLLVPDHSWLRETKPAACAGFGSAFLFLLLYFTIVLGLNPGFPVSTGTFLLAIVLAGTTGTVAAYVRARMDKLKPTATP